MAVTKIQYENKVALEDDPSVAEINKVTDTNMNEIKSVINNNADILTAVETEVGDIGDALDIINGEEIN